MNPYGNYPDLDKINRIMIIKLRHHGDVLLTSPVFSILKSRFKNIEIYAYIYRETLPVLDGHPAIEGFHLYDMKWKTFPFPKRVIEEIKLIRQIQKKRYDLVINLTEGDRGAFTAFLSKAKYRVGLDPEGQGFIFKKNVYTHIIKRSRKPRHMVEQSLDALRRIGIFPSPEERDLFIYIPESAARRISDYLEQAGIRNRSYILIHPTSRWMFKCWPANKVAKLIRVLHEKGCRIVMSSSPDKKELSMIDEIISLCSDIPILSLAGRLTLKELAALIQNCSCLVGIDSLPMHMASALKVPTVALFGPSSEEAWGPWKNPSGCVIAEKFSCRPCNLDGCGGSKVSDCLEQLPVENVLKKILMLINLKQNKIDP